MPYLEQVFYEALRLHPALVASSRQCSEDVDLEFEGKRVSVEKNLNIYIPILQVHYDPEYYVEPTKFHPERFDDGAVKEYFDRCVFMPFGGGPRQGACLSFELHMIPNLCPFRICLGMRFALMQSKACIAEIIRDFEVTVNRKTPDPLVLNPQEFLNIKTGKLWLDFKPIQKQSGLDVKNKEVAACLLFIDP